MTNAQHDNICIRFDDIAFTYDGETRALDGVTLHVEQGEFVCVLGGNGSGKSTLAKHINALLVPDEGEASVLGYSTANPEHTYLIRSGAGMVFQNPDDQLVASIIEDDVAFGPENLGVDPAEIRQRVTDALAQVGLQGFEKKETAALSGGQKQRVAIAGVLAMKPRILVLDEASAMLDPRGRKGLARVCRELNEAGLTIVMITHFMEEAAHADRVVVLDRGRIALQGTPTEVLTQAKALHELALDVPFAVQLGVALRDRGVDAPICVDRADLERSLTERMRATGAGAAQPGFEADDAVDSAQGRRDAGIRQRANCESEGACEVRPASDSGSGTSNEHLDTQAQPGVQAHPGVLAQQDAEAQPFGQPRPGAPAQPVIEFVGVSFTYQPSRTRKTRRNAVKTEARPADWGNDPNQDWALRDVSLDIRAGEFLGLAGHTGSGKSTLIQLANGLLQPTHGTVRVHGRDISDKKAAIEARRDVGVVFQYPEHQLFAATVYEDVAFGPRNLGLAADEVEQRVREALALVHLSFDELRERNPFTLSGGQQRRVAFAGVLAMRPSTLILDEPVAGLDPRSREKFLGLIAELHDRQSMTVVIVSHSMNDLAYLCDRVLVLNKGNLFALDAPERVFADEAGLKAIGLDIPDTLHVANALDMRLSDGAIPSVDELADRLVDLL